MWGYTSSSSWSNIWLSIYSSCVEKEIRAFQKENFIMKLMSKFEEKYYVYQNNNFIAAVHLLQDMPMRYG